MKKIILLGLITASTLLLHAQPITVKSKITDVTVFLQGAQATEEGTVSLKKGDNVLVFSDLARNIDPRSIQAAAPDIVLINSVSHEVNYLKQQKRSPRIQRLRDSLRVVKADAEELNNAKTVLTQENNLLLANQSLAGDAKGVTAEELRKASDYFRSRLHDIQSRLLKNTRQLADNKAERNHLQRQLNQLNGNRKAPTNDIVVKVRAEYARTVKVAIRYLVTDAGWRPRYDLRASDTDSPIRLDYRADVWQTTGVKWDNVNLTLSSGDPQQGGTKPELSQWNLAFGGTRTITRGTYDLKSSYDSYAGGIKNDKAKNKREQSLADYTTMRNSMTTTEFEISLRQSVLTDGKKQQVSIQSTELPAIFQHYAAPKLDKDAFLVARVTDWGALNLLPGDVNIFFEGTYIAQSFIDPGSTSDTLDFSLGRDKKVVIERNQMKDYNSKKTIGTNKVRTFGYEFVVRNTKNSPIRLIIHDQVPISQDAEIVVKDIELSDGSKNETTGLLTYDMTIPSAATQKFKLVYSVKYPKKKTVSGL